MKKSLCGWLSNEAIFYECNTYEHHLLALKLEKELSLKKFDDNIKIPLHGEALLEELGFIKFTQSEHYLKFEECSDEGHVFFFGERLTLEQRKWIQENKKNMSPKQLEYCNMILYI